MTVPGVYSPSQGDPFAATIRAAAESDGVIPDAVKVEAMARAIAGAEWDASIGLEKFLYDDAAHAAEMTWPYFTQSAQAALNALWALEGEN